MKELSITKKISVTAMFIALSYVLALVAHFLHLAPFAAVSFLTYDPKDILICIAGFILGPISALIISVGVSFIEMITISSTGLYGFIMNIISTCSFVIPACLLYKSRKNFISAILSLLLGLISNLAVMTIWNIIITPLYMSIDRNVLVNNYLPFIVLFNAIKTGLNISIILIAYKPIISALRAVRLINGSKQKWDIKQTLIMIALGLFILGSLIAVWILV